jgi:two-component system NtrC family sensor kinase
MSLRTKALLPLFLFSAVLFGYLHIYWSPRVVANIEAEYRKSIESHLDSVVEGLIPLLLAHQLDAVYENLDSLKEKNKDWAGIELINADGKTVYPLDPLPWKAFTQKGDIHTLEKDISYLETNLGKMIVNVDFGPVLDEIRGKNRELMMTLFLLIAIFVLLIGLTLDRIVSRPARLLAHASATLARGDFDTPLPKVRRDEIGTLVGSFATMRDEIRGYQAELIRRNESLVKLSHAVEQSPVSIVITDAKGDIGFVNPKFTQMTGYSSGEVLGKNPRILKSGETSPEEYRKLWESITSGMVWNGIFHNRKKNGDLFWESASISAIHGEDGTITHFVAIKEDITERKRLEEQLRQSQKMEAVGQLAGGIAHDFNNLLTTILGYSEMAIDTLPAGDPLRDRLEIVKDAGERAASLTKQLLAFSRKQILEMKVINLTSVIQNLAKMLRRVIGEDVSLVLKAGEAIRNIKADPTQVEQVLMNLAINARDAMPGGGRLIIEIENVDLDSEYAKSHEEVIPGPHVMLAVTDTGMGMRHEVREKIFEPFFTTKSMGTGLGLSTVYGIVKQHNGSISVYSEVGKGTAFRIYFPSTVESEEIPPGKPAPTRLKGNETILVVDDEPLVRRLVVDTLKAYGYRLLEASSGEEALKVSNAEDGEIDLLLTDVVMTGMDGRKLAETLKENRPSTKVVFMSGYTEDFFADHGVLEDGRIIVKKPLSPRELASRLRDVLDEKGPGKGQA